MTPAPSQATSEISQGSLAAHARSVIHKADRKEPRKPIARQHSCRVSRCGCVAADGSGSLKRLPSPSSPSMSKDSTSSKEKGAMSRSRRGSTSQPLLLPLGSKVLGSDLARQGKVVSKLRLAAVSDSSTTADELESESHYDTSPCMETRQLPPSPSNFELTECALRKSQHLLNQLEALGLDCDYKSGGEDDKQSVSLESGREEKDVDSQNGCSRMSSSVALEMKRIAGVETIEIPVVFLKMISDTWEEMRSSQTSLGCSSLPSVLPGTTMTLDDACKDRLSHLFSRSSSASAASTGAPAASESESDSSGRSPDSYSFPAAKAVAPLRTTRTMGAVRRVSSPVPMSPRGRIMMSPVSRQMGSAASIATLQQQSITRCHPVSAAASSQTVSVTANVPPGSSVSISVTTPATIQHTQGIHLLTR